MGANVKWETLSDLVAKDWQLGVRCRCGRTATINAQQLLDHYRVRGWDTRSAFIHEHLKCARCGNRPHRVGISADRVKAQSVQGPLTLADMRAQGVHHVNVDCSCRGEHLVNVDHLPAWLPVPDVRFRVSCPTCGTKATRVLPNWIEQTCKPPGQR